MSIGKMAGSSSSSSSPTISGFSFFFRKMMNHQTFGISFMSLCSRACFFPKKNIFPQIFSQIWGKKRGNFYQLVHFFRKLRAWRLEIGDSLFFRYLETAYRDISVYQVSGTGPFLDQTGAFFKTT